MSETVETTRQGLTSAEAQRRQEAGQANVTTGRTSRSLAQILRANVFTLFNAIILAGMVIMFALGRWQDALFGVVAVLNTVIGVAQEFNAKRTLDKLAVLHAPHARVLRDGAESEIPLEQVVLGDTLVLRTGDQVTADARVTQTDYHGPGGLEVDESLLTGESDPIRKDIGDEVLSGSSAVAGSAHAEVIRVGDEAYAAQLTEHARKFSMVRSELREGINRMLTWIAWALVPVLLIVVNGQMRAHGGWSQALSDGTWRDAVVGAVASGVAMIPQGLVLLVSIAMALGAVTLTRRKVLVQELPAVEGLARVDVLCLDKTGTITTGEMAFDTAQTSTEVPGWRAVLGHIGRAPDANGTARCLAEPFADAGGVEVASTVPFDSSRKWSASVVTSPPTSPEGVSPGTWVFGAPEFVYAADRSPAAAAVLERAGDLAQQGLRTLALAHSPATTVQMVASVSGSQVPQLPDDLTPVALLTFREQVRPDAPQTLAYFADQGVEVRIISGDDPRTVGAVARQVGLTDARGYDARTLPEDLDALADLLAHERVFGRVTPHQKLRMVQALQHRGHVVGMTGDGVNDALAIKESDLGIAVDSAAQATKAVAQLVLLDGRFDRLPSVVSEGRRVIGNMERVSNLFLTKTTYAVLFGVFFGLMAWSYPFLPRQLSIVSEFTIGIPAFLLALMPNAARYRSGFLRRTLLYAIPAGVIIAVAMIALHAIADGYSTRQMQSASVLLLVGIGLWVLAGAARGGDAGPSTVMRRQALMRLAIVVAMYGCVALVWAVPLSRTFFRISWLEGPLALLVGVIVLVSMAAVEVLRVVHRRLTADPA